MGYQSHSAFRGPHYLGQECFGVNLMLCQDNDGTEICIGIYQPITLKFCIQPQI